MEERKKTLAKLYAIRAGMSVVVQKSRETEQQELRITAGRQSMDKDRKILNQELSQKREELEELRKKQRYGLRKVTADKEDLGYALLSFFGILASAFIGLSSGHWFVLNWFMDYEYEAANFFVDLLLFLWALASPLLALAGLVFTGICIWVFGAKLYSFIDDVRLTTEANKRRREQEAVLPQVIAQKTQELSCLKQKYGNKRAQLIQDMKKWEKAAKQTRKESAVLCYLFEKELSDVLDVRDWENVDLIIYYFETGRADTVKEALQQVDRQRQADTIVQSIYEAGEWICDTMQKGLQELNHNMIRCFSVISEQLSIISEQQQAQNKLLAEQNQRLGQVAEKIDFHDALQAMSHISSQKMAKDVARIRQLSEYREMRERNGLM